MQTWSWRRRLGEDSLPIGPNKHGEQGVIEGHVENPLPSHLDRHDAQLDHVGVVRPENHARHENRRHPANGARENFAHFHFFLNWKNYKSRNFTEKWNFLSTSMKISFLVFLQSNFLVIQRPERHDAGARPPRWRINERPDELLVSLVVVARMRWTIVLKIYYFKWKGDYGFRWRFLINIFFSNFSYWGKFYFIREK